jgi:DNA-binding NarL/FixJ family response regulator
VSEILRIGLIDADADIRFGRKMLIDSQEDCKVVFEEESGTETLLRAPEALIDVLVIDHRVRGIDGLSLIERLIPLYHQGNNKVPAIILTGPYFSQELLLAAIAAGVTDLVTLDSTAADLLKAIRTSAATEAALDFESLRGLMDRAKEGDFEFPDILVMLAALNEKEKAVLAMFKSGLDDGEISESLGIPKYRVRKAIQAILEKCSLATRAQLFLAINAADGKNG